MTRFAFLFLLASPLGVFSQWKDFKIINDGKDTIDRIDLDGKKQGAWVVHHDPLRGEPGYEEEGVYQNDRKEGEWKMFSIMGDLMGIEHYRWGLKDGIAQYFNMQGDLRAEQSWKALNPDKAYDTLQVEDVDQLNTYHQVIVKNEGASLKHGPWKLYDANGGGLIKTDNFVLGKLQTEGTVAATTEKAEPKQVAKPKEVLDFEKKNKGKKVRYQDGTTN